MLREIREHADWVAKHSGHPDITKSEAQTKASLIEPLIRCLRYNTSHLEQVALEVPTELGGKIDYALTGQGNVKIAVEAKRAGITLSEKETNQLRSYFTFSEAVAGILTNGVDYWLFTDLKKTNVMDSDPYRKIDVRNLTENDVRHLESLTRSKVSQAVIHEQAQREQYRTIVNEIITRELYSPSQEFLKLIGRKAGLKPLSKANLEFLGPLVTEAISGHLNKEALSKATTTEGSLTASPEDPPPDNEAVETPPSFPRATLFGQELSVTNYRELLTSVVAELQNRHGEGFATQVRDESVFKGKKWWYVSTELHHFGPKRTKHRVGDHWVDTNLNAKSKVRRARWFLKAFGHDPDELVVHTSDG